MFRDNLLILGCQLNKFKRLQVSMGRPHREEDDCPIPHRSTSNVEDDLDLDALVQRVGQVQQSPGDRELVKLGGELALVLEAHKGQHRPSEFDARRAHYASRWQSLRHAASV